MKSITLKTIATGIVASMLLFTSCTKDGPVGPQGPAGTNGTNGVANIDVATGTTTNSSWVLNTNGYEWDATFSDTAIKASVISNGTIQVFLGDGTGNNWSGMPFAYGSTQFNYSYSIGQVTIQYTQSNLSLPSNPGGQQFKIVVIPPAARLANPNVNYHDYNDIKKHFNVKEH